MRTNIFQDALVNEYRRLCAKAQSGEISEEEKARLRSLREALERVADRDVEPDPEAPTPHIVVTPTAGSLLERIMRAANDADRAAVEQALGKTPPPGRER